MYTSPEKDKAVFYWWKTEHFVNQHLPRVTMAGLHPDKTYRITELNRIDNQPLPFEGKVYSGAFLMENGLEIPYTHQVDYHKLNDYIKASGDLAVKLYKEDIEAALRTKDFGGFELLSLSDYTGQSTATVGILDVFYESKGLISPDEFKILQVRQYRYLKQREYLKIQIH